MELPQFRSRGPQLTKTPQRKRQTETSKRSIWIEIEVAAEHATLDRWQKFAIVAVEFFAKFPVLIVEDRDLAKQCQHQALDRRRVGQTTAVLFDQDHVGPLRERIRSENKKVPTTLTDHPITGGDPTCAEGLICSLAEFAEAEDNRLRTGEIEAVPAFPEELCLGRKA